jgi:hypothetical protein
MHAQLSLHMTIVSFSGKHMTDCFCRHTAATMMVSFACYVCFPNPAKLLLPDGSLEWKTPHCVYVLALLRYYSSSALPCLGFIEACSCDTMSQWPHGMIMRLVEPASQLMGVLLLLQ